MAEAVTEAVRTIGSWEQDDVTIGAVEAALSGLRRQRHWKAQVEQLQQRLQDRIVIERAKGVLVQRLGITEEEAYKRLRVLSRRQRQQREEGQ